MYLAVWKMSSFFRLNKWEEMTIPETGWNKQEDIEISEKNFTNFSKLMNF
jgi:hypothetical protein